MQTCNLILINLLLVFSFRAPQDSKDVLPGWRLLVGGWHCVDSESIAEVGGEETSEVDQTCHHSTGACANAVDFIREIRGGR